MRPIFLNTSRSAGGISVEVIVTGPQPADIARQLPYAASLALNRSALEAAAVVRRETAKNFRSKGRVSQQFFDQSFQVTQFSNKANLQVEFGSSRALLQGRSASLFDHEYGTDRVGTGRNKFPYIAQTGSSLKPGENDLLPRWAYPKALGLIDRRGIAGETISGADRTGVRRGSKRGLRAKENRKAFILRDTAGDPVGIFRRIPLAGARVSATREGGKKLTLAQRRKRGSGQSTLELLFATPKTITIKPRLGFHRIAEHELIERIQANFEGMLAYATNDPRQARNAAFAQADAGLISQFVRGARR